MSPDRASRVADFIRSELAHIVLTRVRDPRLGMLCVTDARVSRDLSCADVYVTSMTTGASSEAVARSRHELVDVLNRASGFLRNAIARRHRLRATPKLRFHYDDLVEHGARMEALIDDVVGSDARPPNSAL